MKITVITGSPRKNGGSTLLVEEFIKGAQENGHEIYRFDAHFKSVNFCIGCNHCEMGKNLCVFKDDFSQLRENLLKSDVLVLATPMYYMGFSAQIKKIIDRFYSINTQLTNKKMKAVLITSQHSNIQEIAQELNNNFKRIFCWWLKMENAGIINAFGIENGEDLEKKYLIEARKLANSM